MTFFGHVLFVFADLSSASVALFSDRLDNSQCIFHSLLDLFALCFKSFLSEVLPLANFVDISDVISREQQLRIVFEDDLIVLGVEPEQICLASFTMFDNVYA